MPRSTDKLVIYVLLAVAISVAGGLPPVGSASACSTPVFRYAMYRWEPAPYEIYYFHDGSIGPEALQQHESLRAAAKSEEQPANLFFLAVDVKEDPELATVPRDVRQQWQALEDATTPCYLIVTPRGAPIHRGDLEPADLQVLVDSPVRKRTVQQLSEGKAGVMLLLTGADEAANAAAETLLKEFVADVARGEIEVYLPPTEGFFPRAAEPDDQPATSTIEVGYLKLARDDPRERWLIESLLAMEQDLKEEQYADQPMMFVVFGRGRVLPPCVGKGIHRDSCTVKDQDPGMDLLVAADWHRAAEMLAARVGAEEGVCDD